ncbi:MULTISPECIES: hypothetical protein [unclassified Duganella]|uniref:hypothetical protein n=1 Tax=unclassified Duganella TaxID=2636909 RepID=UPI00089029DD|nr:MULTISPECIES: hypothetical protein [unclassified Duganella]SDG24616.1 hypothetical protein SAMN05216320_103364 [Duganella sp. OV458]SDJ23751.1 hypothetical protein SAMN05428973_103122 [Duganella sp. OV510]
MPKNKRPVPRKSANSPEVKDEQQTTELCALALDLADESASGDIISAATRAELAQKHIDFQRLLRRLLAQGKNEVLYGAIEMARDESLEAYRYLRTAAEEGAANLILRRDNAPDLEIDAFAIPVFVHSQGGLDPAADFQDPDAYEALLNSITDAGLESPKAQVVLVSHAYDLDEIERINYGQLQAMVREAAQSLTDKKIAAAPALERSMAAGWSPSSFSADDTAVELRFLLGFALKRTDDAFYKVPAGDKAADAYFAQRAERYQKWTEDYAPLVARCLGRARGADPALTLNFLYQDLFFGARAQGQSEHDMLHLLSTLNQALQGHDPAQVQAVIAPAEDEDDPLLLVQLSLGGTPLAAAGKPLDPAADLALALEDLADALASLGVTDISVSADPLS